MSKNVCQLQQLRHISFQAGYSLLVEPSDACAKRWLLAKEAIGTGQCQLDEACGLGNMMVGQPRPSVPEKGYYAIYANLTAVILSSTNHIVTHKIKKKKRKTFV